MLTNSAQFEGRTGLEGASAFLVEALDGRVLAATAKHLIGEAGGVDPPLRMAELDAALSSWQLFPRTDPEKSVALGGPVLDASDEDLHDWLLLALKGEASREQLPATPLRVREEAVRVGEKVFLVGVPYSEPDVPQNVYSGVVTARAYGDRFKYTLSPPVDLRGFSGAPILDRTGRAVGVMTIWFDRELVGGKDRAGGGEDIATALERLKGE